MVYLGPSIADSRLDLLEKQIGFRLPADFKYLLKKHNGFSLAGTQVYGLDAAFRALSLDQVYSDEHSSLMATWMPVNYLPFSPDGAGNHYCLVLSKETKKNCPVAFWQYDAKYDSYNSIEICNASFTDWVEEVMIQWTLDCYNYDGSEKY